MGTRTHGSSIGADDFLVALVASDSVKKRHGNSPFYRTYSMRSRIRDSGISTDEPAQSAAESRKRPRVLLVNGNSILDKVVVNLGADVRGSRILTQDSAAQNEAAGFELRLVSKHEVLDRPHG